MVTLLPGLTTGGTGRDKAIPGNVWIAPGQLPIYTALRQIPTEKVRFRLPELLRAREYPRIITFTTFVDFARYPRVIALRIGLCANSDTPLTPVSLLVDQFVTDNPGLTTVSGNSLLSILGKIGKSSDSARFCHFYDFWTLFVTFFRFLLV